MLIDNYELSEKFKQELSEDQTWKDALLKGDANFKILQDDIVLHKD
jgi:hypothetical protein